MSVDELSKISSSGSDSSPSTKGVNVFLMLLHNQKRCCHSVHSVSSVVFSVIQNNKCRHWHCTVVMCTWIKEGLLVCASSHFLAQLGEGTFTQAP